MAKFAWLPERRGLMDRPVILSHPDTLGILVNLFYGLVHQDDLSAPNDIGVQGVGLSGLGNHDPNNLPLSIITTTFDGYS